MQFFISIFILSIFLKSVSCTPVLMWGVALVAAAGSSTFLASYNYMKCYLVECCDNTWIKYNHTGLQHSIKKNVHGQHLIFPLIGKALQGHLANPDPPKALVFSFHGWTGSGKNFVCQQIAQNLFKKGMNSENVHLFVGTFHFPRSELIEDYKDQLREWIKSNVSRCGRSMFIFDEVDKLPDGLLNVLVPFVDHHRDINGVDYRKSIFIFLSNLGSKAINHFVLKHWEKGLKREDITQQELEKYFMAEVINTKGGLFQSELVQRHLINVFVPFLPMESSHVKLCIEDDLRRKNIDITPDLVDRINSALEYFPNTSKLLSASGCKRVPDKVDYFSIS